MLGAVPRLFRGTILDNLSCLDPDNIDRATEISEAIGLDGPLGRLAHGYQTQVGAEFGTPLATGAVKRVGLVRAFSSSPGLTILNNPTYGLDKDGIDRLAAELPKLTETTTIIILAREATLGALLPEANVVPASPVAMGSVAA